MGIGAVIGGALQGFGNGLAQQGQMDALQRREIALENLRSQNRITETEKQYNLQDRNDSRQVARQTNSTIVLDNNRAGNAMTLENLRTQNDGKLESFKSKLRMTEDQVKAAQEVVNAVTLSGKQMGDTQIGADGTLYVLSKTGEVLQQSAPGIFNPPSSGKQDALETLLNDGGTPAAGNQNQQPVASPKSPGSKTSSGLRPTTGPQPTTRPAGQSGGTKTYTASEVKAAAKELGWSEQQVRDWAKAKGWKLTN